MSPDQDAGYAKYKKALPVKAGFKKFFPVPPNISLPITKPTAIPRAACQSGAFGGQDKANKTVVTKAPSLTSCLLMRAKINSQPIPTAKTTT